MPYSLLPLTLKCAAHLNECGEGEGEGEAEVSVNFHFVFLKLKQADLF